MAAAGDWFDAPADILWKIIKRLPFTDYIRFGVVCVSWHTALSEKRHPPAYQAPLLLLPGENTGVRFFNQADNKEYHIYLHNMGLHHRCIGSSGGWLVSVDEFSELHMFKPFSPPAHLRLPSITTLPNYVRTTELLNFQNWRLSYFIKVIVSSSSPLMIAAICTISKLLAFTVAGDKSWSSIFVGHYSLHDIIFYRNQLYGLTCTGTAIAVDLSDASDPRMTLVVKPPSNYTIEIINHQSTLKYLVESPDGDILQICRRMVRGERVRVFKMIDPAAATVDKWIELKSLGDYALFLGHNHSLALSAKDFSEVRRNCIYFTDNRHNFFNWHAKCNLEEYHMEDGSITPYYGYQYQISRPPVWFDLTKTVSNHEFP